MTESANNREVGGTHYQSGSGRCPHCGVRLQHWDVVIMFNLGYLIGNATKYLFRYRLKSSPLADLDKAVHYIEKQKEVILSENEELSIRQTTTELDPNGNPPSTSGPAADDTCGCQDCVQRRARWYGPQASPPGQAGG